MKLITLIGKLQKKGYNISFYKRKDGGLLVKTINGERFTGAKGNLRVRSLGGAKVYTKQLKANRLIAQKYVRKLPQSIWKKDINKLHGEQLFKRVHREWKLAQKKGFTGGGKVTWKKYQYNVKNLTMEETERLLRENFRYAKGYAYTENVNYLQAHFSNLKGIPSKFESKVKDIQQLIQEKGGNLKESQLQEIIQKRYDYLNKEITLENYFDDVIEILQGI